MNVATLGVKTTQIKHNHVSREIQEKGKCPACNEIWSFHESYESR